MGPKGWTKYKAILIAGCTTDQTELNYMSTVNYESSMNADFSDIRFIDSDMVTLLDQHRESYISGISSIWWIQVDIPTAGKTIYMVYGNAGASLKDSGENTFPFFDDFTGDDDDPPDDTKWGIYEAAFTKIYNNNLRIYTNWGHLSQFAYGKSSYGAGHGVRFRIRKLAQHWTQHHGWGETVSYMYCHKDTATNVARWLYHITADEAAPMPATDTYCIIMINMITSELKRYYYDDVLEYSNDSYDEPDDQNVIFRIEAWAPGDHIWIDWVFVTKLPDDGTELDALTFGAERTITRDTGMLAARWMFILEQGAVFDETIQWVDKGNNPHDLTSYSAKMQVRGTHSSSAALVTLVTGTPGSGEGQITLGGSNGTIRLQLTSVISRALTFTRGLFDLELSPSGSADLNTAADVIRLMEGPTLLSKEATK